MRSRLSSLLTLVIGLSAGVCSAPAVQDPWFHAAQGLAAAEGFPGYANLCDLESRVRDVNARQGQSKRGENAGQSRPTGSRTPAKPLPPTRIFDNLYFFGTSSVGAWLYGTEEGYLLIDSLNNDQEAEQYILGGMAELGLESSAIRYILVTHAHGDHYGGADLLAERLGIEIMMSAPDWLLARNMGTHPRFGPPPVSGLTVHDGQTVSFGRSKLDIHLTPGHTPGTISPVFEVQDGDARHSVMLWGGTGFNFGPNVAMFEAYADSAIKMREISRASRVDVFVSSHPRRDGSIAMMSELANRASGAPHPFVRGESGYALFTVLEQCALAQAARFQIESSQQQNESHLNK